MLLSIIVSALPYHDSRQKGFLKHRLHVSSRPTVVVLDGFNGEIINENAVIEINETPTESTILKWYGASVSGKRKSHVDASVSVSGPSAISTTSANSMVHSTSSYPTLPAAARNDNTTLPIAFAHEILDSNNAAKGNTTHT